MKHWIARWIALSVMILTIAISVAAQERSNHHGLVITGTVLGVETKCLDGKPIPEIQLYLQFRNDGEVPLLLIRPSFLFTAKVNFATDSIGDSPDAIVAGNVVRFNPYLDNPFGSATRDDYDPVPLFMKNLDTAEPPFTLSPGGYLEFHHTVWVRNGFRIDMKSDATQYECVRSKTKPVPEYSSLNLEFHMSFKKYEGDTDFLQKLQNRWKRFGHLLLDRNGDVTYKSEKILFDTGKMKLP